MRYRTGAWDLILTGDYADDKSDGTATRELSGNPSLAPALAVGGASPGGFFDVNVDTPTRQRIRNGGLNLTIRRGDTHFGFTSISGYRTSRFRLILDQDATQIPAIAGNSESQESTSLSQEFQLAGATGKLHYIAGLYYFHERADDHDHFVFGFPFTLAGFRDLLYAARGTTRAYAAYGQATFDLTSALSATLGARVGHEKKEAATANTFNFAALPPVNQELESNPIAPKLGFQYRFSPAVNAYLSATRGFKSGGVNSLSLTNEVYGPESLWAYELGLKADWLDRRLRTNLATFYYDYRNMQVNTYTGLGTRVENAGFATIEGAELEVQTALARQFHLDGQVSYLDAAFDKYVTINPDNPGAGLHDLKGNRLPRSPKWSYSVAAQYDFDVSAQLVLSMRGEYQWRDSVFYSQFESPLVGQKSFSLMNASVSLKSRDGRYSVSAWARNLGDTHWYAFVGESPGVTGVQAIPAAPRTYGLTLSYDF
jgi:iron complex outermembrane receptor protein